MTPIKERIPEDELMQQKEDIAFLNNNMIILANDPFVFTLRKIYPKFQSGIILDMGCGAANTAISLALSFRNTKIYAIDLSDIAIQCSQVMTQFYRVTDQVEVVKADIKSVVLDPPNSCDMIVTRSTLHHFNEPQHFWGCVKKNLKPTGGVFIQALVRPKFKETVDDLARQCVNPMMAQLRHRSYMAAYRPEEVEDQLLQAGLGDRLCVTVDPNSSNMFITNKPTVNQEVYN